MPRKRRIAKLSSRALRWDDVGPRELLEFFYSWRPPLGEFECSRTPWLTLEEYLNDWVQVRAGALPDWEAHRNERLAHLRAEVARRTAALEGAETDSRRELWGSLLADVEKQLDKEERRELPFAECAYQRVLAGTSTNE